MIVARGLMTALAGFSLATAAAAQAPTAPVPAVQVTAANPQSIVQVLMKRGYRAELTTDSDGDPLIKSGAEGVSFLILFFNCKEHRDCATVQFYVGFDREGNFPLDKINSWNREKRFGRAYVDKEGDPVVEMDIDLDDGGMSAALFEDNLEFCVSIVAAFRSYIDAK